MSEAQTRVQTILDDMVARDEETGLQVAAYYQGELVVDAWAGSRAGWIHRRCRPTP